MAREVIEKLIDDLDGSEATETVTFGLDGTTYEIDLNKKNAAALRKAVEPYVKAARKGRSAGGRRKTAPAAATKRSVTTTSFSCGSGQVATASRCPLAAASLKRSSTSTWRLADADHPAEHSSARPLSAGVQNRRHLTRRLQRAGSEAAVADGARVVDGDRDVGDEPAGF